MSASRKTKKTVVAVLILALVIFAGVALARGKAKPPEQSDLRIGKAEIGDVQVKVTEVGTVEPEVKVDVKSPVSGKVVDIFVRDGDVVERGAMLAKVEPDLNQAQSLSQTKSALRAAEINYEQARQDYESDHQLFTQGLLSPNQDRESETRYLSAKQEYDSAREKYRIVEASGIPISQSAANFQGSNITAPMRGVVLTRNVEIGETVTSGVSSFNAGTVLFSVADVSSMIIKAGINEVDIGRVHVNQPVKVTLDAFPKISFPGRIDRIAPAVRVDDKVRVFDVEVRLDAQGKELRSGMTANIEIIGEKKTRVLTVPVEAVFQKDDGEIVYVKKTIDPKVAEERAKARKKAGQKMGPDGKPAWDKDAWKENFDLRQVKTGLADNSKVEILAGLKAGEEVALQDPTLPKEEKEED